MSTTDSRMYFSTDSNMYWIVPPPCVCKDNSFKVGQSRYLFESGEGGVDISNFQEGTRIKKVSGFRPCCPHTFVPVSSFVSRSYVGIEYTIKSITLQTFACGTCGSERTNRDVTTFTLVDDHGEKLVLSESKHDQNPFCRGW